MRPGKRRNQKKNPKILIADYTDLADYVRQYSAAAARIKKEARPPKTLLTEEEKIAARRQYSKDYFTRIRANAETRKALNRKETLNKLASRNRQRILVLAHYGVNGEPVCRWCGFDDLRALAIDHINDDGAAHRKTLGNMKLHAWLVRNKYPEGFQTLCFNCNAIKEYDRQTRVLTEKAEHKTALTEVSV